MLLKTTTELKKFFSNIQKDYNFNSIQSFVIDAESEFIIPSIGRAMYDKLDLEYNALGQPNYNGKLKTANELAQKAITHLAFYFSADSGSFHISDSGFYVSSGTDNKPVSDKKMVMFRDGRISSGLKAVDELIDYLEQNIDDPAFQAYKDSDERKHAASFLIPNARIFTRSFSPLKSSGLTFRMMLSTMDSVEETYICKLLGEELFEDLKDPANGETYKALLEKVRKPLALLTIAESIPLLQFNYDGSTLSYTVRVSNNDNVEATQTPNEKRLSTLMNACLQAGQQQLQKVKAFLDKNAASYPLYTFKAIPDVLNPNDMRNGTYLV